MKKILISLMSVVLVIAMVGGGAFAYFSDTETSTGNSFAAGTLDLAMGPNSSVTGGVIATASNMAPGVVVPPTGSYEVNFKNIGTLPGFLTVNFSYAEDTVAETGQYNTELSADDYAKMLVITEAYLKIDGNGNGPDVAPYWAQQITDAGFASGGVIGGLPTIYGLSRVTLHVWNGYQGPDIAIASNSLVTETFKMKLHEDADNKYQSDGVIITVTGTLSQTNAPLIPSNSAPAF